MSSNISGQITEDAYLNQSDYPIIKSNFVVISGCSGGGKSTLISELSNRGYVVVHEPGRQIVKEQLAINGDALPWSNLEKFLDLALSRYLFQFNSQQEQKQLVFFDRSIIDAVQLKTIQPEYFRNAANNFRYNRLVFLVPPWEEIFASDAERKHGFESAKKEFDELLIKYREFGYETILIPKIPVKERVDFILNKLGVKMNAIPSNYSAKKIAEEYANTVWNAKDISVIDRLIHQNVIIHSLLGDFKGAQAMKEVVQAWLKAFPDLSVINELVISENDLVSIQWSAKGTHQGEFKGRKPTGKKVSYSGVTVYRINDGQIVEYWAYLDMQTLLRQIE